MAFRYLSNRIFGSQIQPNNNFHDHSFSTFPPTQFQLPLNPRLSIPANNLTISQSFIEPILPIEPSYPYYNDFFTPSDGYGYGYDNTNPNCYLNPNSPTYSYLFDQPLSPINPIYPKRQRLYYEDYVEPDPVLPNPPLFLQEFAEEVESSSAAGFVGNNDKRKNGSGSGGVSENVSAQSIAARQRRRRISEKTKELGKLVPGGQRMNTAEMFQAAFKHIKFLQAQVWVLEMMGSFDQNQHLEIEEEETFPWDEKEMAAAVTCPRIQEKLHSKEKCLVPKQVLKSFLNHSQLNSEVSSLLQEFILTLN